MSGKPSIGIPCPKCNQPSAALETRAGRGEVRRRRRCMSFETCGHVFTTYERVDDAVRRGPRVDGRKRLRRIIGELQVLAAEMERGTS